MFDNVAFEVVIGLVFIYLLYSLLITIIGEMISTKCGIRARLLRIAIERMMNDGYYQKIERKENNKMQGWFRKIFLYEPPEFKTSFAGKFYEYPAIKYLGRIEDDHKGWFSSTKPSYFSPDYFADTLINFLRDKGAGSTDMDKIGFCLKFNTYHIQPKTLKQFRNLFENAGNDKAIYRQNLIKWFNETMDRNNGWYKRKMRIILFWLGLILAISFNIDTIRISKILANDKEARSQLVSMGLELSKDSLRYKDFINSNGDTVHSKAVLDSGFSHVTRDINAANLVLGLGWEFNKLKKQETVVFDKNNDSALSALMINNLKAWGIIKNSMDSLYEERIKRLIAVNIKRDSIQLLIPDTLFKTEQIALADNQDKLNLKSTLKKSQDSISSIEKRIQNLLLSNKFDSATYGRKTIDFEKAKNSINKLARTNFLKINAYGTNKSGKKIWVTGERNYCPAEKFYHFLSLTFVEFGWVGFLITALALSLGAPFWFDLLNKLVSIRGVGVKPEEKKDNSHSAPLSSDNNKAIESIDLFEEDKINTALRIYRDQIKNEKGVINVVQGYRRNDDKITKCIQVNVEDSLTATEIKSKYSNSLRVSENDLIPLNVLITGRSNLAVGFENGNGIKDKGISNGKTPDEIGSFGCLVNKIDDPNKTFLLSCYHVMNADGRWDNRIVNQQIINPESVISIQYEGYLNNWLDTAIAQLTDQNIIAKYKNGFNCRTPKNIKKVTEEDVFITKVFIQGFNTTLSVGVVVNHSSPETFNYPTSNDNLFANNFDDLIIIGHDKNDSPEFHVASRGDSGAIVLDNEDNALGIVVGVDLLHTYVIKIDTIFSLLGLQLITL